jgi:hypothetical protein
MAGGFGDFMKGLEGSPLGLIYGPHGLFGPAKSANVTMMGKGGGQPSGDQPAPQAGQAWGEPAQPSTKTSPTDYIHQFMGAYGNTGQTSAQQVYSYLSAADPQALKDPKSLQQALTKYAQYAGWQVPGQQGAQSSASTIDPLAVQMFFQQTIAPYLNQVAGSEKATADTLRNQPMVKGLPASYAATIKQGQQTQAADMDMLQQATLAAGATQPQVTMLNQMLGLQQKASLQDYYRNLAAGTGGAAAAGPPTGGY